ncbi:LPXTG cell wall anchor domain-containing protein [Akkermansiaceae bacterium]|nr:LPXTG cell wall anchor domain-containing protein [Akkermansiaceae bacterium]MDB4730943.1 LPXTG cell wall anchor domain-containing protein [Akkermansiaceae bacterium]
MKSFLKILKYLLFTILIVGLIFVVIFFRVWQNNERPGLVSATWDEDEVLLGHSRDLSVTIRAPWHRDVITARPVGHPDFLPPVKEKYLFAKGDLDFSGYRLWHYRIPLVATDTTSLEGKTITLPIKRTGRIGPNSVTVPLPELTINLPGSIPPDPENPQNFLNEEPPLSEEFNDSVIPEDQTNYWLIIAVILILLGAVFFLVRRQKTINATPPWERALSKLDRLALDDTAPEKFFSQLTDILKQYTAERYLVPARAKTSSEFIRDLKRLSDIPEEHLDKLPPLARLADGVKFAGLTPDDDDAPRSQNLVRSFVVDTTPKPDTETEDA